MDDKNYTGLIDPMLQEFSRKITLPSYKPDEESA